MGWSTGSPYRPSHALRGRSRTRHGDCATSSPPEGRGPSSWPGRGKPGWRAREGLRSLCRQKSRPCSSPDRIHRRSHSPVKDVDLDRLKEELFGTADDMLVHDGHAHLTLDEEMRVAGLGEFIQ